MHMIESTSLALCGLHGETKWWFSDLAETRATKTFENLKMSVFLEL